eukprot:g21929.t1
MSLIRRLIPLFQGLELRSTGKWFFLSSLIGIVGGIGAIGFQLLGQVVMHFTLVSASGYSPGEASGEHQIFAHVGGDFSPVMIVVVMICGGLVSGWLVYTFAPEAEGHGTDAAIDSFHNGRGYIRGRIPIIKTIASAVTLGTGGSGGREGPIAQIGAGFGSFLATRLGLSARDRRIMLAAGMGAGVGAIFRAPLAGALFAGEIMYRDADLESDVIVPAAISSIVGYSVYSLSLPASKRFLPLFGKPQLVDYAPGSPLELLPFALLSLVLVLVSILYIKVFYGTHRVFKKVPVIPHVKPAIGAGLAGIVALTLYYTMQQERQTLAVLSTGYGSLQQALTDPKLLGLKLLLAIALVKILTTSLTISSGGSGGVFGPSMVIGGCVGAAVGILLHDQWPDLVPEPAVFAMVEGVYRRDRQIRFIPEGMTLDEIVHTLAKTHQHYFPVVNEEGRVVGIFSSDDVRSYLYDETIWHLAVARDIMVTNIVSVTPDDDLNTAMQRFTALNLDELPVFDPANPGKLLGMLRRKETIAAYNRQLLSHKQSADD